MKETDLLAELEELLRTMPARADFDKEMDEVLAWRGRASAIVSSWDFGMSLRFETAQTRLSSGNSGISEYAVRDMIRILHQARVSDVSAPGTY